MPLSTPSPKSSTYTTVDHSAATAKIKKEYHIKEEDSADKDRAIKAEPGHHDKISMGLFPSDLKADPSLNSSSSSSSSSSRIVKKETLSTSHGDASMPGRIRIKEESMVEKCSSLTTLEDGSSALISAKSENSCTDKRDEAIPSISSSTSIGGRRRGRSAGTASEIAEEVVLVKRRGAILS